MNLLLKVKWRKGVLNLGNNIAIELKNITKTFGSVVANNDVCLTVSRGEILSILGENGSGKTTLMNMISGIYFPDEGQIFVDGKEAVIASPKDAFQYGIGMIHQHFKLVDVFTAAENIVLKVSDFPEVENFKGLDIIVANAGIAIAGSLQKQRGVLAGIYAHAF